MLFSGACTRRIVSSFIVQTRMKNGERAIVGRVSARHSPNSQNKTIPIRPVRIQKILWSCHFSRPSSADIFCFCDFCHICGPKKVGKARLAGLFLTVVLTFLCPPPPADWTSLGLPVSRTVVSMGFGLVFGASWQRRWSGDRAGTLQFWGMCHGRTPRRPGRPPLEKPPPRTALRMALRLPPPLSLKGGRGGVRTAADYTHQFFIARPAVWCTSANTSALSAG